MFSKIFKIVTVAWAISLFATNPASVDYVNYRAQILQDQINNLSPGTTYTAGTGIDITGNVISGDYVAGSGINITGNVISATGGGGGTTYTIGQFAQGGVVFWLDPTNEHGLAAAIEDQDGGSGIQWYNGMNLVTAASGNGVYLGKENNLTIIEVQGAGTYAATVCAAYTGGGYMDWYLPSIIELGLMYIRRNAINTTAMANGGSDFASASYWSSFESGLGNGWSQNFSTGAQASTAKSNALRVRAIRAF